MSALTSPPAVSSHAPLAAPLPLDLRSDTLTRPTAGMRAAMASAEVGDDVFGEDPTVQALQRRAAELTGMAGALWVPTGTMANQIALLAHCRRGDEVVVGWGAHSYLYEGGAGAAFAGVQFNVLSARDPRGCRGFFSPEDLSAALTGVDPSGHRPPVTLVMLENTHNRGGGRVMSPKALSELTERARAKGVPVHIDGARLPNAAAALSEPMSAWGEQVSSLTFCLSKGLGAPAGSLLCGGSEFIRSAHRWRKALGGGLRQVGILAAAGLYALEHHLSELPRDHANARRLAHSLARRPDARVDPSAIESNIVLIEPIGCTPAELCERLAPWVRVLPFGEAHVRAVLHRDIDEGALESALTGITGESP